MLNVLLFVLLVVVLIVMFKNDAFIHEVLGGVLGKGEHKSKYVISEFVSTFKSKMGLESLPLHYGFDHITFKILQAKKEVIGNDLYNNIKMREHDNDVLEQAMMFEGCIYDKEVEMLSSLVYVDDNDILRMPFYNEPLLRLKIVEDAKLIFENELTKSNDVNVCELNVIKRLKVDYEFIDKALLDNVIKENL